MQRFEDVLQQCACHRDRGSVTVLQTGGEPVIHKNIQRPVVSWRAEIQRKNLKTQTHFLKTIRL